MTKGTLPYKFTQVDTIVMHFVPLPVEDTSLRFLYMFTAPLETVWRKGRVTTLPVYNRTSNALLEEFALTEWRKMMGKEPFPEQYKWVKTIDKVTLVPCKIVPE